MTLNQHLLNIDSTTCAGLEDVHCAFDHWGFFCFCLFCLFGFFFWFFFFVVVFFVLFFFFFLTQNIFFS